jgi:hypothetical protein
MNKFINKIFLISMLQISVCITNIESVCINPNQDIQDNIVFRPPPILLRASLIETTFLPKDCALEVPFECQGCEISYDDYGCFSGCSCNIAKTFHKL